MKYDLFKRDELVGEAVKLSESLVYYHLWKNIRVTYQCSLEELKKKFRIQLKEN